MPPTERFDDAYYREFYGRSPVQSPTRIGGLAQGVLGMAAWWGIPVRSVLDVGAGPGYWGRWLGAHRPDVRYRSVDVSAAACRRYGHEQRDIVEWQAARPVDLVVSDVRMPGLGGFEAVAWLRELGCRAPVILITAFGDRFVHAEGVRAGAVRVLDKPFELDQLRQLVRELFAPSRARASDFLM